MNPSQFVLAIVMLGMLGGIAVLFNLDRLAQRRRDAGLDDGRPDDSLTGTPQGSPDGP